jgi:hypothetical protein
MSMFPRFALGLWVAVALLLIVAAITMRLFKVSTTRELVKQAAGAVFWPVLLFSAEGRKIIVSIIKDTQT